ncbi:MAG: rod shape-determining protein MreD [Candidatus Aminicenantes bacterium]|nr:MAG: rod shape-determining protein MreD [Candidatus Aminicenantes bacterium]
MNRKFKVLIFILLILGEIIINKYIHQLKLNLDLLYLILVYISVKSGFIKCLIAGTVIGLVTDYFSMNVMGVFGFSRTLGAYLLHESSWRIDLKNNFFVFLLVFLSLSLSNLVANTFFIIILDFNFSLRLILYQPFLTGLVGVLIVSPPSVKRNLDVY